jgi:hypothetical protein
LAAGRCDLLPRDVKWLGVNLAVYLILIEETESARTHINRVQDRLIGIQPSTGEISPIGKNICGERIRIGCGRREKNGKDKLAAIHGG